MPCLERCSDSRRRLRHRSQHPLGDVGGRGRWCRVRYRRSLPCGGSQKSYALSHDQTCAISPFTTFQKKITSISHSRLVSSTISPNRKRASSADPCSQARRLCSDLGVRTREHELADALFRSDQTMLLSRLPLRLVYHLSLYPTVALWLALRVGLSHLEYYRLLRVFPLRICVLWFLIK
jgi:hypothetical protein